MGKKHATTSNIKPYLEDKLQFKRRLQGKKPITISKVDSENALDNRRAHLKRSRSKSRHRSREAIYQRIVLVFRPITEVYNLISDKIDEVFKTKKK